MLLSVVDKGPRGRKRKEAWSHADLGHIPALPLTSYLTLGKLLKGHHNNDNDLHRVVESIQ